MFSLISRSLQVRRTYNYIYRAKAPLLRASFHKLPDETVQRPKASDDEEYRLLQLLETKKWAAMDTFLTSLIEKNTPPSRDTYHRLFRFMSKRDREELYSKYLTQMKQAEIPIDVATYKAIIASYGNRGSTDALVKWLEHMIQDGQKPDEETLHKIIPKLFNQYFEKVPVPGKYLFNTYGQQGKFVEGTLPTQIKNFTEKLAQLGISLDVFSYNLIFRQCFRLGRMPTALMHFEKMKAQGIKPDINSYKWIMGGLWKEPEEVLKYFQELKKAKIKPDVHIYNRVLYAVKTQPKEMVKYYREMKKKSLVPTDRTLALFQTAKEDTSPEPTVLKQLNSVTNEISKVLETIKKEEVKNNEEEEENDID